MPDACLTMLNTQKDTDMPRYNHAVYLGFEVISDDPHGEDITPEMLKAALLRRIALMDASTTADWSEWTEACLPPEDTFEED